ncbi:MAG: hypothetical protein BWY98_00633 [Tenericutes bacterium ADurb.BinA155]|jgi:hypothetical protein|nr:MAG: hypothetical protein BWY98_00633 [Tenericutes bacterium ADurb.BinA155]
MEQTLQVAVNDAPVEEAKEHFFSFNLATLKRPGVILRLASILICYLAILFSIILPMVTINYATYSSSTTFDPARAAKFPSELIPGQSALFGGGYFAYYLKSKYGVEILYTAESKFNPIVFSILVFATLITILAFLLTFSKKLEKLSKLVTLGYVLAGIGVLCSPIWFMTVNSFGNTAGTSTANLTHYFVYDSLYVHTAYGAIVSCLTFVAAAILFGIGTNRENAGGDNRNGGEQ